MARAPGARRRGPRGRRRRRRLKVVPVQLECSRAGSRRRRRGRYGGGLAFFVRADAADGGVGEGRGRRRFWEASRRAKKKDVVVARDGDLGGWLPRRR